MVLAAASAADKPPGWSGGLCGGSIPPPGINGGDTVKTALKRIIAAVAVFGALSALCYSCAPVKVSAANIQDDVVEYCQDYINEIYNLYHGGVMPENAVQNEYAAAYAVSMYISKSMRAAYEPDFHNEVNALLTGFYFDTENKIHVTTFYTGLAVKQNKQRFLIAASDEHYCILEGIWPIGENVPSYGTVSGYGCKDFGSWARQYSWLVAPYFGSNSTYYTTGFTVVNDYGNSFTDQSSDFRVGVDLSRPAQVCTAFPPADYSNWGGYLPIPQSDGTTVEIKPGYMAVNSTDFTASDGDFRNIVNNYIVQNYPSSDFQVPETIPEKPAETLPNDEYSGLPAGWNEINPVPLPDIQTPSSPLTDAEIENAHDWLTDFSFWASVQSGLAFWFAAAAHAAEINETVTEILLGMSLLAVLGYVIWRWGI